MQKWLPAALDYIPRWIEFQMRQSEQPGCVIALADRGKLVLEQAFGSADLDHGAALTPRHRFRVASHSKSFTSAGIMKLREAGRLHLDDMVGHYVGGLHRSIAEATIAQLLSHSAGLVRDGWDSGQWQDRRPFLDMPELKADLAKAPIIAANTRFKYSNHGFGLAGMVIEAITGEPYKDWIKREIVDAVELAETEPDMPTAANLPMARGHSAKLPAGRRFVIPGDNPTNALAPATGFVSTAADLVHFFAQLDPAARHSVLSAASRREMTRRQWQDPHSSFDSWYGLGLASGRTADCDWFGHGGGFQGFITRTSVLPERGLAISILTNASDGWAHLWWGRDHADPLVLRQARRADGTGQGLERTVVDAGRRDRSAAGRQPGADRRAGLSEPGDGCQRDYRVRRGPGQDRRRPWVRPPWRGGAPQARKRRRDRGNLGRRHALRARAEGRYRADQPLRQAQPAS
jgi:D-alanyl-D-alanine carboxypeptidase